MILFYFSAEFYFHFCLQVDPAQAGQGYLEPDDADRQPEVLSRGRAARPGQHQQGGRRQAPTHPHHDRLPELPRPVQTPRQGTFHN